MTRKKYPPSGSLSKNELSLSSEPPTVGVELVATEDNYRKHVNSQKLHVILLRQFCDYNKLALMV